VRWERLDIRDRAAFAALVDVARRSTVVNPAEPVQPTRAASLVEQFARAVGMTKVEAGIPVVAGASEEDGPPRPDVDPTASLWFTEEP
jgi:hypothetical protein